ncbi:MAG TPA: SPOR domain-containing protein [Xanthobacteraceae bacterium]|jgi:hypothetical protein
MADDHPFRSLRPDDLHRRAAEPAPRGEVAGASDPLAELARLIGQSDRFAELGRNSPRPSRPVPAADYDTPPSEDWRREARRAEPELGPPPLDVDDYVRAGEREYRPGGDFPRAFGHEPYAEDRSLDSDRYGEIRRAPEDYDDRYVDDRMHDPAPEDEHGSEAYFHEDAALPPQEEEVYDDPPRARHRSGLATALALIGCAMIGTAGAYAYRSYYPGSTQPPPVITADTSTPTKILPAGDSQSSRAVQDRLADAGKEQIVTTQEEPVVLKEVGTQSAPRVVLPAPVPPAQAQAPAVPAGVPAASAPPGASEAKRIRTVTIHPEGTDLSGRPVGAAPGPAAASRSASTPAPRTTTATASAPSATAAPWPAARGGSTPLSLDPQTGEPVVAAPPRTRTVAAPPAQPATEPATGSVGGFVVQLSSQRSESEAQAVFRTLQAKFPSELGDRQPIIRRADLGGNKGVVYRTQVGPFGSAQDAQRFCASYKAAGGQCFVP